MKRITSQKSKGAALLCLFAALALAMAACTVKPDPDQNLVAGSEKNEKIINLFGPMEKSKPDTSNLARTAFDLTISIAEEDLGLTVEYRTYTAENYQEKTYDDVVLDRVRNNMDDLYLLNPDTIQILGRRKIGRISTV